MVLRATVPVFWRRRYGAAGSALASALRALRMASLWFMNGTYKVKPELAAQVYTIHYAVHDDGLPTVYAFMKRKSQQSYEILFRTIRGPRPPPTSSRHAGI